MTQVFDPNTGEAYPLKAREPTEMEMRCAVAALCGWNGVPADNAVMKAEWERVCGSMPLNRDAWLRVVRAVIGVLREPTAAMIAAGEAQDDNSTPFVHATDAATHWRAMIDAASPGETP